MKLEEALPFLREGKTIKRPNPAGYCRRRLVSFMYGARKS